MSDDLLPAIKAELAELERELERNPAFVKHRALKAVANLYERAESASIPARGQATAVPSYRPARSRGRAGEVVAAVEAYFKKIGRRAQTAEIYEHLMTQGISIGGQHPIGGLSSTLSHSDVFNNRRPHGYGLAVWGEEDSAPVTSISRLFEERSTPEGVDDEDRDPLA